jgi:malonyl CoA-acyl carrier protein transacylase
MKTAVIICPGRGTYNAPELGVLKRQGVDLSTYDALRARQNQPLLAELDGAATFSPATHTRGDNASGLIYAASVADADALNGVEVVAVTGNSMGWYSAVAVGGALSPRNGFDVTNTMGSLMHQSSIGGQSLYPFVDSDWVEIPGLRQRLLNIVDDINAREGAFLAVSIHLGGMLVVAGNEAGLVAFEASVEPRDGTYPLRLRNHAGFHTSLQNPVAAQGQAALGAGLFEGPSIPMIDGRGAIWWPFACKTNALRDYTLGHQVTETYDFSKAVQIAAQEFAPDLFIVTGPGTTLGGAVAQSLIQIGWRGIRSKSQFQDMQSRDPVVISMGRAEQRKLVV